MAPRDEAWTCRHPLGSPNPPVLGREPPLFPIEPPGFRPSPQPRRERARLRLTSDLARGLPPGPVTVFQNDLSDAPVLGADDCGLRGLVVTGQEKPARLRFIPTPRAR